MAELPICCGTYSYCRGSKGNKPVHNLHPAEALIRIAASAAGFTHVFMGGAEVGDLIGAPFGSAEVDMAKVTAAKDDAAALGLTIHACLLGFSPDGEDAVEEQPAFWAPKGARGVGVLVVLGGGLVVLGVVLVVL